MGTSKHFILNSRKIKPLPDYGGIGQIAASIFVKYDNITLGKLIRSKYNGADLVAKFYSDLTDEQWTTVNQMLKLYGKQVNFADYLKTIAGNLISVRGGVVKTNEAAGGHR